MLKAWRLTFTYVLQNDIVGRDSVGRHEEQSVLVDFKDLADFAAGDLLQSVDFNFDDCFHSDAVGEELLM